MGAFGMHLALFVALFISLNWSRQPPLSVQAELWSSLPPIMPASDAKAVAQPVPQAPPAAVDPKADIALEKAKKDQAQKAAEDRKREEQKKLAEQRRQAEEQKRLEAQAAARLSAQRQAELARLGLDPNAKNTAKGKDIATKAGVSGGAELGSKTGELAEYAGLIRSRVQARIRFDPSRAAHNPEVVFIVEQLPTGEISLIRKIKSSGVPAWDEAVERAIRASDPLPKKKDGTVERVLELRFRPLENR